MPVYSYYDGIYLGYANTPEEEQKLREEDIDRIRDIAEGIGIR